MALSVTCFLVFLGALLFFILEYNNTMQDLSLWNKLISSLFQSVSTRTAGFYTLDFSGMANATLFGTIMLMVIGACPGSTGGGIKTTTIGVLIAILKARFKAREDVSVFKRTLPIDTVSRAISIVFAAVLVIIVGFFILMATEAGNISHVNSRGMFVKTLFEAVSAYGTVGLSMGLTEELSYMARIFVIILMFIGRLGPLTIAIAVSHKESKGKFQYAEENLMVG